MIKEVEIKVAPLHIEDNDYLTQQVRQKIGLQASDQFQIQWLRRSIDARSRNVHYVVRAKVYINESIPDQQEFIWKPFIKYHRPVYIIGAGPAGLFAALELLNHGIKPIVIERGKDVRARRRDLAAINKEHIVNPESNYCFGEGGAGTYSDGKLYTRSGKRGSINKVLEGLVHFGANSDILINAHPHIGTNKLPKIIQDIREAIIEAGGEVHFEEKLIDISTNNHQITSITTNKGKYDCEDVILATGHSARDIYHLLHQKNITIEVKPFALGVRIEHPQELIDQIQYKCDTRDPYLPAASYSLVQKLEDRGAYSFCMCPGGIIAPCATSPGEVVTNGWSPSKRNNPYANSGFVVELKLEDFKRYDKEGPLAGLAYQSAIEQKAWHLAGETQKVPAQRMVDFMQGKLSANNMISSYQPGTTSIQLEEVFPNEIHQSLKKAFQGLQRKMPRYVTNEAILHATESRTSSPVRIPRDRETMEHIQTKGLYPCAEGAGYAGGIVSAAIDGQKCAAAIAIKRAQ